MADLMMEAYHLMETTPAQLDPRRVLEDYTPLTKQQYPIFNKYPKFIVDFQVSRSSVTSPARRW